MDLKILDVYLIAVEGSASGQSAWDFNELKLTKKVTMKLYFILLGFCFLFRHRLLIITCMQVLIAYVNAPLSAMELQLVNNVRSRFNGLRPNNKQW